MKYFGVKLPNNVKTDEEKESDNNKQWIISKQEITK